MTQPTNHRAEAEQFLAKALAALTEQEDPAELAIIGILQVLLAGPANRCPRCGIEREAVHDSWCPLSPDPLDDEEQHQSEKFETSPLAVEVDDTVESPRYGLGYIDDNRLGYPPSEEPADRVRVPGFAEARRYVEDPYGGAA